MIDSGEGICADDVPRLFEPFFTTRRQGTGLGLAIVRRVVEAHGGRIAVSSAARHGSTFEVVLPVHGDAKKLASFGRVAASSG